MAIFGALSQAAFTVQSHRGVYALLVGSGISRSAKIPTGWEITADLVRKLALACGEDCGPDPFAWYKTKFSKDADYSDVIATLGRTPEERSNILRCYFEPTETERQSGEKLPTAAHKAIAALIRSGYIRVVITTNFDRLLESALVDQSYAVIATADQVDGAVPLIHSRCTILKLHGDYLDTRIKNTEHELSQYDPRFNRLLDRIFDEFGVIVCGWSAEWDPALRAAIERAPSRRYTFFWAARNGVIGETGSELVAHRAGVVIPIKDSDSFFIELESRVKAIEDSQAPHPLSIELARAETKRLIPETRFHIRFHDLLTEETERCFARCEEIFKVPTTASIEEFNRRLEHYRSATEILLSILTTVAVHGSDQQGLLVTRVVERLSELSKPQGGVDVWLNLRYFPMLWAVFGVGVAACSVERFSMAAAVLLHPKIWDYSSAQAAEPIARILVPARIVHNEAMKAVKGYEGFRFPVSEYLFQHLRQTLGSVISSDRKFELAFDLFEFLLALEHGNLRLLAQNSWWAPPGRFVFSLGRQSGALQQYLTDRLQSEGGNWSLFASGFTQGNKDRYDHLKRELLESFSRNNVFW